MASRKKKADAWEGQSFASEARHMENVKAELISAMTAARDAADRALGEVRAKPNWPRTAKDTVIGALAGLQAAIVHADLTAKTTGQRFAELPGYNDNDHPFTRARRLAADTAALLVTARTWSSALVKASYGDAEKVQGALETFQAILDPRILA